MVLVMLMVVVVVVNMMGVWAGAHGIPRRIRNCPSTIAQFLEKENYTEIMFAANLILETNDRIKIMQNMNEYDHCIDCDYIISGPRLPKSVPIIIPLHCQTDIFTAGKCVVENNGRLLLFLVQT